MSAEYDKYVIGRRRRFGLLPAQDEGFFGEMAKGAGHSFYTIFHLDLDGHRNWDRPESMAFESMIGRYIGECWFITLPILIFILWACIRKAKKKAQLYENLKTESRVAALAELESGNLHPDTWAKALIAANGDKKAAEAQYIKLRKL